MEWTDFRILWPKLKVMKPYLPRSIFSQVECIFRKPNPTREQLTKIATLGESIGLSRTEIVAAVDAPLSNQGMPSQGRVSRFMRLALVSILLVASILIVWAIFDPASAPIHTYTPGTDYGTIRPQDFSSHYPTQLER